MQRRSETWDSLWAQLLRIDFFAGKWEMYRKVADSRAEWLEKTFQLDKQKPVLSCACGEGGIELALARRGFNVTGIDICPAFIHFAREQASTEQLASASFLTADLRGANPLPDGFGAVFCFDTLGLLSDEEEQKLVRKMASALLPGGLLLVDCPLREAQAPARTWWEQNDGYVLMDTRWDKDAGVQYIDPIYITAAGEFVELRDPYDQTREEHTGVIRYLYTQQELARIMQPAGLHAQAVPHQRKGYFMLAARRGGPVSQI
ncbi:class I SAM-dependent methyltransferase [bacterium]|nr:class I SAM-dependent methyltransferase [bacterium]